MNLDIDVHTPTAGSLGGGIVMYGDSPASHAIYGGMSQMSLGMGCALRLEPALDVPFMVPEDELFYWSYKWQAEEAAASDEIARGDAKVFDSGADAIRWLLDPTDDDA